MHTMADTNSEKRSYPHHRNARGSGFAAYPMHPKHPVNKEISLVGRDRPFAAYRFLVEIEGQGVVAGAFTNFSGIKMSTQIVQARVGNEDRGVKDNYPGITEYQHVTLTKGVIGDNGFLDWLFSSTLPGTITGPQGKQTYRNLNIVALTDTGERGVVWTLLNAIPVGYELQPMDASQSAVLSEQIEFAITGVKRTVNAGNSDSIVNYTARKPEAYDPGGLLRRWEQFGRPMRFNDRTRIDDGMDFDDGMHRRGGR